MSAVNTESGIHNFARSRKLSQQHLEASQNFSEQRYPSPITPVFNTPNLPLHQSTSSNFPWQQPYNSDISPSQNDSRFSSTSKYSFPATHRHTTDTHGAYMRDTDQFMQRIEILEKENLELRTECTTLKNAFQMLANCVGLRNADANNFTPPPHADGKTPHIDQSLPLRPPLLSSDDYDTKFWDIEDWKIWCNSTEGCGSIKLRGSVPFLEDEDGNPLVSTAIDSIRRTMCRLFEMLASKNIAPPSWGRLSEQAYLLFHIAIGTAHPELRFCSNDWKANELAKNVYSAWRTARRQAKARAKGVKSEELDQDDLGSYSGDDEDGDDLENRKRSAMPEDLTHTMKRHKTYESPLLSSSTTTPSSEPEELTSTNLTPSAAQCDKPTAIETWTVPQIKLKNPLDGLTLPQKSPLVLPSSSESTTPVLKSAAAISQPNALIDGFAGKSPEALVKTVMVTPPLVDTPIPNGQPTTSVSSVPIHSVTEPTKVPKKASKARPSSKKNGRDLCILHWLKQVKKDGTTAEFRIYWDALDTQQCNSYESEAVQLVSSNVWVKNTVGAVVDGTLH
ncbi:uncharacterized protein F5147DRAFT_839328 [Suillus discolor]|uniref:Uncharacterized protein n=1 Tax=Suillus discolor TaxID=1912936 RepID=A0A9P7JQE1_9AGAM|nr:uncharacterized protein F5147DRAFT_839328 [Suillus discolor]KAG2099860.1 hypothetical protein F5147DRAFT_839328 [Suillus discolor]